MSLFQGFVQLGAGLSVGLAGLAAGFAIGIVGDAGVRGTAQQPRLFVGMVCICAFNHTPRSAEWLPIDPHPHFCGSVGSIWFVIFSSNRSIAVERALLGLIVALIMNGRGREAAGIVSIHSSFFLLLCC